MKDAYQVKIAKIYDPLKNENFFYLNLIKHQGHFLFKLVNLNHLSLLYNYLMIFYQSVPINDLAVDSAEI